MSSKRIYESSSGDTWDLVREDATHRVFVKHTPNLASGGNSSHTEVGAFLRRDPHSAEHAALVALIGSTLDATLGQDGETEPVEVKGYIHDPKEAGGPYIAVVLTGGREPTVTLHKSYAEAERELEARLAHLKKTTIAHHQGS